MPRRHTKPSDPASKVAVSLPATLLRRVEALRSRTGETRSAVVRRALELLLHRLDHYDAVREYVEGYRLHPEGDDELQISRPTAEELDADPWVADVPVDPVGPGRKDRAAR